MSESLRKTLEEVLFEVLRRASTDAPEDMVSVLKEHFEKVKDPIGRSQLNAILSDIEKAYTSKLPICQDSGLISFIVHVGEDFPIKAELKDILIEITKKATKEIPLRPNAVDLFKGNTKNNIGLRGHVPWIYWDITEGDTLEVIALPKGGGSSNIAKLYMLNPGVGWEGIKKAVIDAVADAGAKGCPPYVVGVGIGGGEDIAMTLGKFSLLRKIGERHPDPEVAKIEEELLEAINALGIGVMGLGAGPTAIDVHIELAARHPASLPVGVVFSCWALRHAHVVVYSDGSYEFL